MNKLADITGKFIADTGNETGRSGVGGKIGVKAILLLLILT